MIKKKLFKYVSVFMCATMITVAMAGCTNTSSNNTNETTVTSEYAANSTEALISEELNKQLNTTNTLKTNTRNETVYVFDDANGKQDHIIVNEKVTDASGNTTSTQENSSKEAPVTIKVTYYLDGSEISADKLAGKSGKVKIRFDYTNNEKKTIKVNGTNKEAYVPFTMISGMILDSEKFSNVEVTNGQITQVGDNYMVMGLSMPGLKDTLNLKFNDEQLDMDIPEYFEVSADVKDFELDMTMSAATSNILSDVDIDKLTIDDLKSQLNTLQSAADQLTEGTGTLQDGTQTLADSIPALTSGVNQLNDGASQLKSGIYAYTDGAAALAAGSGTLNDGIKTYTDGVTALATGSASLDAGLKTYAGYVSQLAAGSLTLSNGTKDLYSKLYDKENGMVTQLGGLAKLYKANSYDANGKTTVLDQANSLESGAKKYGINDVTIGTDLTALASADSKDVNSTIEGLYAKYLTAYTNYVATQMATGNKPDVTTGIGSLYANQLGLLIKAAANIGASEALTQVAGQLSANEDSIKALQAGAEQINGGLNQLNGNSSSLISGAGQINAGLGQLNENSGSLVSGASQINAGLEKLNGNNDALRSGIAQLADGTATLSSSAVTLADGVEQLNAGAITLKDGMAEFNETGIKKITSLVGQDADNAIETLKQVVKLGKDYQSFTGKSDGKEGKVTFIYKTSGITK